MAAGKLILKEEVIMKAIYFLVALSFSVLLYGCATFQGAGQYEAGKQALYAGNYPTALAYFTQAEQTNPDAVYGATLRLGILTYVGQTQYLTGRYTEARQTLRKELLQHPSDNVALLYLGLTEARLGNRQAALGHIEKGMMGIDHFLNYITSAFRYSFGQFWDPSGNIRASIKQDLTLIQGANTNWPALIAAGEKLGIRIEEEEEKARQQQQQMMNENFGPGG
jgi:tetratricopeptide (TPR) repeat protein